MLKCILFLLSQYYYEIMAGRMDEIYERAGLHDTEVVLREILGTQGEMDGYDAQGTLVITDDPEETRKLLEDGWYVVILYHEKNRGKSFPAVRYGVEDVFMLEYRSYEEAFKRLAGLPWDILETRRLKVRESTVEDVDEYYRIYREPSITLYIEDLYEEREAELAYMRAYIDQIYGFYGYGLWTVLLKETGQVIGRAGLSVRQGYELPELGFVIDVEHQKQGYGYEVCMAILRYAKKELDFNKVQALVDVNNQVSQKLLCKLGFEYDHNVCNVGRDCELLVKKL